MLIDFKYSIEVLKAKERDMRKVRKHCYEHDDTEALSRNLTCDYGYVYITRDTKGSGFSVRCLRD